jgi:glycosyltransferase involved in cell wall biosynthesis
MLVNHTSRLSGAERSLLEQIRIERRANDVVLVCPPGDLATRARALGVETVELPAPHLTFAGGFRELAGSALVFARAAGTIVGEARRRRIDVIRAASARAGLLTAPCSPVVRARRIVDVRDALPRGVAGAVVRIALRVSAHAVVFNSEFTRSTFGPTWPAATRVSYPPVDLEGLLDLPLPQERLPRRRQTLGVIGQITPWKGQDTAILALAAVRRRFPDATLRIVGAVVFPGGPTLDNDRFRLRLAELAAEHGVLGAVTFDGEIEDIRAVLEDLDVLLVPSHREPFGRVVAEGMAAGVPVVATRVGGPAELIDDGVSGLLVPPGDPPAWAEAVCLLLGDHSLRARIATAARRRVTYVLRQPAAARAR